MKRVLALLYFGVLAMGSIYAQGIEFFHGTYEEALQKARAEGKQIFVDVYTSWCGPCKMMAKNVFTRQEVGDYYNNKFVCLKLDAEKESSHAFLSTIRRTVILPFFGWMPEVIYWILVRVLFLRKILSDMPKKLPSLI